MDLVGFYEAIAMANDTTFVEVMLYEWVLDDA